MLQLTYDDATTNTLFGQPRNARLGWHDGTRWVNAVSGNAGGIALFAGDRAYNPATDFRLGTYGIDTAKQVVWAVVNHGGLFGVTLDPDLLTRTKSTSRSGTSTTLKVESFTNHTYQLQRATSLAGGSTAFTDVDAPQSGSTGTTLTFTHDDGSAPQAFYRIKVSP